MTNLEAKIKAVNLAHTLAKTIYADLSAYFKPLIGKKVIDVSGGLLKKYREEVSAILPIPGDNDRFQIWKTNSTYSLSWRIQVNFTSDNIASYHSVGIYIGFLDGQNLDTIAPPFDAKSDYTLDEVQNKIEQFKIVEKTYNNLKSEVGLFT